MNEEDKKLVEEAKKVLKVGSLKDIALHIGYSKTSVNDWYKKGLSDRARYKIKGLISQNPPSTHKTISVPKLKCTASAGGGNHVEGIDSFEEDGVLVIDRDTLRVNYKNLRAMRVEGHSMVPVLLPDSWVIFDDTDHYVGDGLYVINFRNILMVKMLQVDSEGRLKIVSANKEYESFTIDMDDQSVFKIFGKVRRCII